MHDGIASLLFSVTGVSDRLFYIGDRWSLVSEVLRLSKHKVEVLPCLSHALILSLVFAPQ